MNLLACKQCKKMYKETILVAARPRGHALDSSLRGAFHRSLEASGARTQPTGLKARCHAQVRPELYSLLIDDKCAYTWLSFETKAKARLPVRLGVGWLEASGDQRRPPNRTAGLAAPDR
jgi:hypothetical protein